MDLVIHNNKKEKNWYKVEAYNIVESDEMKRKLGACLFHVEDNEVAIYQILLLEGNSSEYYDKVESFIRTMLVRSISIGLFEAIESEKIAFLKEKGFTEVERSYDNSTKGYILHLKKGLRYHTIWDNMLCRKTFCTFDTAKSEAPEGYRLPTFEEAQLFCKLFKTTHTASKFVFILGDGATWTGQIEKDTTYGYSTYPDQVAVWVDKDASTIYKSCIACYSNKNPQIESRSMYMKGCALYLPINVSNEVQKQIEEPANEAAMV